MPKVSISRALRILFILSIAVTASLSGLATQHVLAAACQTPATDYGQVTTSVSVPASGTYRIWSRFMPADTSNNSFLLEVDGTNCYNVSTTTGAGTWQWVDYQGNTSTSKVTQALAQGNHTLKLIGNAPGVKVDRIVMVADQGDQTCTPTGFGDNCNVPDDTTPPTVTISEPTSGSTVSGTVKVSANASDNVGVSKVDFYVNSQLMATSTTSPYSFNWDT